MMSFTVNGMNGVALGDCVLDPGGQALTREFLGERDGAVVARGGNDHDIEAELKVWRYGALRTCQGQRRA